MNNQNKIEMAAVSTLLIERNNIQVSRQDFNLDPEEPADVIFIPTGEKFQVTEPFGSIGKLLNYPSGEVVETHSYKGNEVFEKLVVQPVKKKTEKYGGGQAVNDIALVIYDSSDPPLGWLEDDIRKHIKEYSVTELMEKSGFKEIWITFLQASDKGAIKIYE